MRIRHDPRCLICVFSVFWDVRGLRFTAFLLKNQTSLVTQHMELAPVGPPEHLYAPRCMIYPAQQVNRPGAKVGFASLRAAPCGPCLCRGGQRSVGWRRTWWDLFCPANSGRDALCSRCCRRTHLRAAAYWPSATWQLILSEYQISSMLLSRFPLACLWV